MAKREWGAKHTCMGCGVKFYDLHRSPIACPKCGTVVEVETVRPSRRRPTVQPEPAPPANEAADVVGTVGETSDDDGDAVIDDGIEDNIDDNLVDDMDDGGLTRPAS